MFQKKFAEKIKTHILCSIMSSQLIGTIKRTIFRKVRTILKIYNTLVSPTFLYGSENWTLSALQDEELKR